MPQIAELRRWQRVNGTVEICDTRQNFVFIVRNTRNIRMPEYDNLPHCLRIKTVFDGDSKRGHDFTPLLKLPENSLSSP